jgi:hypothetical protein
MEFVASIGFENYANCENHLIPHAQYVTQDNFVDFDSEKTHKKEKLVSMIYSNKQYLDGQRLRHKVGKEFADIIDCYGSGAGEYIDSKDASLNSYRYHVAINNTWHPTFVDPQLFDPIKTLTVPIYWGGGRETIEMLGFDDDGILFFEDTDQLESILNSISDKKYEKLLPSVRYNRERLAEIRNYQKLRYYWSKSVGHGYCHSVDSFGHNSDGQMILSHVLNPNYTTNRNFRPEDTGYNTYSTTLRDFTNQHTSNQQEKPRPSESQLENLNKMYDKNIITQKEFEQKKESYNLM